MLKFDGPRYYIISSRKPGLDWVENVNNAFIDIESIIKQNNYEKDSNGEWIKYSRGRG
tara:strand:- start:683 stop:856 length:174 start_codon:yes stop_codon:yes gene_type:complete